MKRTQFREHGVSNASIYPWKAKYGSMDVSEAKRLNPLEDLLGQKMVTPAAERTASPSSVDL